MRRRTLEYHSATGTQDDTATLWGGRDFPDSYYYDYDYDYSPPRLTLKVLAVRSPAADAMSPDPATSTTLHSTLPP